MEIDNLLAISPIDGRYRKLTQNISKYFSEYAYIKYRILIEIEWLKKLLNDDNFTKETVNTNKLMDIYADFDISEAKRVKEIEETTNHDVKAIEYYIREKLEKLGLEKYKCLVHFGCTSEDVNNLAYSLMLKDCLKKVIIPNIEELIENVKEKAVIRKGLPMLSHTHGQAATPTTVGKELAVFVYRWNSILEKIKNIKFKGKFSGAVGTYSAHVVAYDNIDWIEYTKHFVESLELEYNPLTTQIENHDTICELFSYIKLLNNITLDFNGDMWTYISMGYFKQKTIGTETGSSVMPHKVNPINHENSMANVRVANSIIDNFNNNLQISRMQRDLSDSSNLRNIGVALAHTLVSVKQSIVAINKMEVNEGVLEEELDKNPEVLAEAIQTVLRKNGYDNAYELLKNLTRGKKVTLDDIRKIVKELDIDKKDKEKLLKLTPETYTGLAANLVDFI
ncbi:MAG: adenylosuccinate lyase [Clostridia bacterium]|nr:adenylosuccinate lyase [Clostridia bacterium]